MNKPLQARDIQELKDYALKLPEPVKTLILSVKEDISEDEFLSKFIEWRKLLRMQEGMR